MSKLALLSGATPRTCTIGPKVRLQRGTWELECDGLIDSELFITSGSQDSILLDTIFIGNRFELVESSTVQIGFRLRGKEPHISIFARKVG